MIKKVDGSRFCVTYQEEKGTITIDDGDSGLYCTVKADELMELREIIDYMWQSNRMYRLTNDYLHEGIPAIPVSPFTSDKE